MTKGWEISDRRKALFVVHEGEDLYLALGRQMEVARPNELGAIYMMRQDPVQREAMMVVQEAKTAVWTRRAVFFALGSIPVNALVTFLVTR